MLVGAAIRMGECMGLHRDGETYGMNPLDTHVRRLVWHQLCFLDIRTCEAQGPRPSIRRDEFDTKLPLNVDDVDLHATGRPPPPADRYTDATVCLIRFEVNEMMRTVWVDRPRLEKRKISLTAVLSKIETFKSNMATKYDHLLDERIPVQKYAKILKVRNFSSQDYCRTRGIYCSEWPLGINLHHARSTFYVLMNSFSFNNWT